MNSLILGIESSCDETAAAAVRDGRTVLSNVIASQHDLHERFGGVVPEIAGRAHLQRILPVIDEALEQARVTLHDLDAVAVGHRPGLIGSLLVGVAAAKALAWSLGKPLLGVDHVRAHLYAGLLSPLPPSPRAGSSPTPALPPLPSSPRAGSSSTPALPPLPPGECRGEGAFTSDISPLRVAWGDTHPTSDIFPALGLVVSGGHTSLYRVDSPLQMSLLGRTIDDALGECYDKVAAILELGFPGGPLVDQLAQSGNPDAVDFPRTLLEPDSLDFSFSGIKTAVLYHVRGIPQSLPHRGRSASASRPGGGASDHDEPKPPLPPSQRAGSSSTPALPPPPHKADICASFQHTVIDVLITKLSRALHQSTLSDHQSSIINYKSLFLGGGVSANSLLRSRATEFGKQNNLEVRLPNMEYCLDNAAMLAGLAHHRYVNNDFDDLTLEALATTDLR